MEFAIHIHHTALKQFDEYLVYVCTLCKDHEPELLPCLFLGDARSRHVTTRCPKNYTSVRWRKLIHLYPDELPFEVEH